MIGLALTLFGLAEAGDVCVVRRVEHERGTHASYSATRWSRTLTRRVEVDDSGMCQSEGTSRWTSDGSVVRRGPGDIEVVWLGSVDRQWTGDVEVALDPTGRPISKMTPPVPGAFRHDFRATRDADGRLSSLQTGLGYVSLAHSWGWKYLPIHRYNWFGDYRVAITSPTERITLLLYDGLVSEISLWTPDFDAPSYRGYAACPKPYTDECLDAAHAAPSDEFDEAWVTSTMRVVAWDFDHDDHDYLPTRVLWVAGRMEGIRVDTPWFTGEERRKYDRNGRLVEDLWLREGAARRVRWTYTGDCDAVRRDWRRQPDSCPFQDDAEAWFGWPYF